MKTMRFNQQHDAALLPGLSSSLLLSFSSLPRSAPLPLRLCDCLPPEVVVMAGVVGAVVLASCTMAGPVVTLVEEVVEVLEVLAMVVEVDRESPSVCALSVSTAPTNPARRSSTAEELRNFPIVSFVLCCRVTGGKNFLGTFMWIRESHTSIHILPPPTVLPPPPTLFTTSPPLCPTTSLPFPPEWLLANRPTLQKTATY